MNNLEEEKEKEKVNITIPIIPIIPKKKRKYVKKNKIIDEKPKEYSLILYFD